MKSFLKAPIIFFALILCLSACIKTDSDTPLPPTSTTAAAIPSATTTHTTILSVIATPTQTPTATSTPLACLSLLSPDDGQNFADIGMVNFSWEEQPGAAIYKIVISFPSGEFFKKELNGLSYDRYLESLTMGGDYSWQVTAVDAGRNTICTSDAFTFSKAAFVPTNTPGQSGGENSEELPGPPPWGDD